MRWKLILLRTLGLALFATCLSTSGCATCPIPSSPHASLLERQPSSNLDDVHADADGEPLRVFDGGNDLFAHIP